MDGDKFISTTSNDVYNLPKTEDDGNFFLQADNHMRRIAQTEPVKHINDFDSDILQEGAYKNVNDEIFKLEYRISKTEEELKSINKQIQTANEIYDYYLANTLNSRRLQLEEDLKELTEIYRETSLSAKISGGLTSKVNIKTGQFTKKISEFVLSKLPGKIASILAIRRSLNKLENINKSVDELMKSRYPYGEAVEKYEQLSKYIARANTIQAEIYRFMK